MTENTNPAPEPAPDFETALERAYVAETSGSSEVDAGTPPAPAEGTTPEATPTPVPPPDSSPAGTTPEGQSTAADVDPDFLFALKLAGISDPAKADPKVIGQKLIEFNQKIAAQEKELKAFRAGTTPAETPPSTPTPQALAAQPASVPVPVPAPPVQSVDLETRVTEAVSQDHLFKGLTAEWAQLEAEAAAIVSRDARGNFVGELPDIDAQIAALTNVLAPPEALKKLGVQAPEIDEFQREQWGRQLSQLRLDRAIKINELQEKQFRGREVHSRMETRKEQYRQHYQTQIEQARRDEERETGIETKAKGYLDTWNTTFEAVRTALKVEDADRPTFYRMLKHELREDPSGFDNPKEFIERHIKAEQKRLDDAYRARQARNATLKRGDNNQSAPPASGAIAPPLPTANPDWEASLHAAAADEWKSIGRA